MKETKSHKQKRKKLIGTKEGVENNFKDYNVKKPKMLWEIPHYYSPEKVEALKKKIKAVNKSEMIYIPRDVKVFQLVKGEWIKISQEVKLSWFQRFAGWLNKWKL